MIFQRSAAARGQLLHRKLRSAGRKSHSFLELKPMGRTDCQSGQQGEGKTGGKLRKWLPYVSEFYLSQDLTAR